MNAVDALTAVAPAAALVPDFDTWGPAAAVRHRAVLARDGAGRALLLADREADPRLVQVLEARVGRRVRWQRCEAAALDAWLEAGQRGFRALGDVALGESAAAEAVRELSVARLAGAADGAASPAVRLLDAVLYDALQDGASDVHVENDARGAELRLRIDGVLLGLRRIEGPALAEQIVSRLKVMAELDIGERRLPQDGRFKLRVDGRDVDFRLSVLPSAFGEDAVVRVLDRGGLARRGDEGRAAVAAAAPTLAGLGFEPGLRERLLAVARRPHGMLLVTGPTGSGKTTTLYAAITETATGREKTITVEDPVEYRLPGVVQVPVNERKGLGFARGLRSILRHDPDRVMVGEIRDAETAQIAVQAALTGHLVFSTLHANSVFDVLGRLLHMGLEPYAVVGALQAVLAQRLLRQRCTACGGTGCAACRGTGYRGRRAVAELLVFDDGLRDLVAERAPIERVKQAARERGLVPLRAAAQAAVAAGWTTAEEVERVTADA